MTCRFSLGQLTMTRGIAERAKAEPAFASFVDKCLTRYRLCDWGDLDPDDRRANDAAVKKGDDRILAAYKRLGFPGDKIWIITEWDRSYTTILFPHEY